LSPPFGAIHPFGSLSTDFGHPSHCAGGTFGVSAARANFAAVGARGAPIDKHGQGRNDDEQHHYVSGAGDPLGEREGDH
jgi:hypothetical protein